MNSPRAERRSWNRWIAAWVACNILVWWLAHLPSTCAGGRGAVAFVAVLLDVFVYIGILTVLPWKRHRRFSAVVAAAYPIVFALIVLAYGAVVTSTCAIE